MWFRRHPRYVYLFIFLIILCIHIIVFRDVIAAIPQIITNNASIVREELVPFFSFGSQFWGDGTSALTSSEEVRVSYSFWTAWVRHYQILPFALVILNSLSAFLLFYAFHRIGRYFYKKSLFGIVAACLASFLVYAILLYAKIAHFYVLIIGFSMFALSLSLFIEQVFFKQRLTFKNVAIISGLVLFNPAIHYHVIFYVVIALILLVHMMFTLIMNRRFFWKYFKRNTLYFIAIIAMSLVPYVVYIFLTSPPSSDISTQIPVNYWMIYYASLSLPFIFSLDTAGHLDLIRYGNYLAPIPRFGTMIVAFLIGGLLIFKRWKSLHIINKVVIMTFIIVMLFAMWMTIGYSENSPYSFHRVFGDVAVFFANTGTAVGAAIASAMKMFINILRFPHRFQFIYFYAAGVLFMVSLVWLRDVLARKLQRSFATACVVVIALFPLFANNDYRTALTSGDLATFVAPYRIPDDLKAIKRKLAAQHDNKLFILPTLESGREIMQDGKSYSFLDKYLIYYLNEPTLYYGVGANTENKLISYLAYRAIAYDETWWQDILAHHLGITDILVPQHIQARQKGTMYLPDIDKKIMKSLADSNVYEKTFDGKDYTLYSIKNKQDNTNPVLIDMNWQNTLRYFNDATKKETSAFFPLQLRAFMAKTSNKKLMTDSIERSYYDIAATQSNLTFVPNPVSLPFSPEYVASSNFTNNALSLSTLYSKSDTYNYLHENVPSLVNLQRPSFVGLTKGDVTLEIKASAPASATYRVLLHGGSKGDTVRASIDGEDVELRKIEDDRSQDGDYIDFTYFYTDIHLSKGAHEIQIKNTTQNAILVDSMTLLPVQQLPADFTHITLPHLQITPTDEALVYDILIKAKDEK